MIRRVWRLSHFALALVSSVFILLAALTGVILSLEPIQSEIKLRSVPKAGKTNLSSVIQAVRQSHDETFRLAVNEAGYLTGSFLEGEYLIHPETGENLSDLPESSHFFEFVTNFHRSLFLKTTGRIMVGITSFLLCLITITGIFLLANRMSGWKNFFSKIKNENFYQFTHVTLGRFSFIPIFILALSGAYLSMDRFGFFDKSPEASVFSTLDEGKTNSKDPSEFGIFRETSLNKVKQVEFPFSPDEEDYFILETHHEIFHIHQYTGEILEYYEIPNNQWFTNLSFSLHTGSGSIIWSLILGISSLNIVYFLFSGFAISLKRLGTKIINKTNRDEAEFVILYGSENGGTRSFVRHTQLQIKKAGIKAYVDTLNNVRNFPHMKHLVVMTSTYGSGDPPTNANLFLEKSNYLKNGHDTNYTVVGFGSRAYPKFCQFAIEAHANLKGKSGFSTKHEPFLIHNKSVYQYNNWLKRWGKENGFGFEPMKEPTSGHNAVVLKVTSKKSIKNQYEDVFIIEFKRVGNSTKIRSGDLLAVKPPGVEDERLYSIGVLENNNIILCIKRHEFGRCSNYLNTLEAGSLLEGRLERNEHFHFPKSKKPLMLIANGTGIAPFLGIGHKQLKKAEKLKLFWGTRTSEFHELCREYLEKAQYSGVLTTYKKALSKESSDFQYVQQLIRQDSEMVMELLSTGGVIMICGSLTMQDGVFQLLAELIKEKTDKDLGYFRQKGQILTDCY